MKKETYYKKPLKQVYKIAQRYFNKYIRMRDPFCITCSNPTQEAGHFNHGGNRGMMFWVDFSEENLNGQCTHCNHFLSGNLGIYSEQLEAKYGQGIIQKLNALSNKENPLYMMDALVEIIENYKEKIKKLKQNNERSAYD